MESFAQARYIRIAPQKLRLVADKIRGRELVEVVDTLKSIPRVGSRLILKVVLSAAANGKVQNANLQEDQLYIKKVTIDEAPMFKRFSARARGRASRIKKRNSHITVVLSNE